MTSASNSFTANPPPLYDVWLVIVGRGTGLFDHCGVSDIARAERLASDYHRQACTLGLPHFTYVVHRRGDPHPPPWQEDDLPFGDDRIPLPPVSSVQMATYTEEELFGTRSTPPPPPPLFRERSEGEEEGAMQESATEEHLLASFLRGELLHEDNRLHDEQEEGEEEEEAEMEPDELYRVTWPYRHDYRPPSLSSAETEGGEDDDDDALFSF